MYGIGIKGLVIALVLTTFLLPLATAEVDGAGIGSTIAQAIRGVIMTILDILTPIINVIGIGMVVIGLVLGLGLRQEFLGFRLAIGGALALATVHLIVPILLSFV